MSKQNPTDRRNTAALYNNPSKNSVSKNKKTRMINFRLPLYLDDDWREAIYLSGNSQTSVLVSFITSYIKFQRGNRSNAQIDETINALMEKRARNDRSILEDTLDDAIARLKKKREED